MKIFFFFQSARPPSHARHQAANTPDENFVWLAHISAIIKPTVRWAKMRPPIAKLNAKKDSTNAGTWTCAFRRRPSAMEKCIAHTGMMRRTAKANAAMGPNSATTNCAFPNGNFVTVLRIVGMEVTNKFV